MKTPEEILESKLAGGKMLPFTKRMMLEAMEEYAQESSAQVRENLSYYIGLADRYFQEGEALRVIHNDDVNIIAFLNKENARLTEVEDCNKRTILNQQQTIGELREGIQELEDTLGLKYSA